MENGAFYINTISHILENKNRLSGKITIYAFNDGNCTEKNHTITSMMNANSRLSEMEALTKTCYNDSENNSMIWTCDATKII